MAKRFKQYTDGLDRFVQEINSEGREVGKPIHKDSPRGKKLLVYLDNPKNKNFIYEDEVDETAIKRMAGEDPLVRDAIKYLDGNVAIDSAMADAEDYLNMRRPELEAFRRSPAQSLAQIEEELQSLGTLRGGVPAPQIRDYGRDGADRYHTRYEDNVMTGQKDVVPFIDTETDEILVSELGKLNLRPHTKGGSDDTANETVALNILKLMDEEPASMNRVPGMSHYSDGLRGDTKVEMMIADRGRGYRGQSLDTQTPIPTHTALYPTGQGGSPYDLLSQPFREARRRLGSTESAVNELARTGYIEPLREGSAGKLLRSDINEVAGNPNAVYDELLVTGYPEALTKRDSAFKSDTVATAPDTIHRVKDLGGLRNALANNKVKGSRSFINNNRGFDDGGRERARAFEVVPHSSPYIDDLTLTHPFTQQLLQNLPFI